MANKKISELDPAQAVSQDDLLPIVQSNIDGLLETHKITVDELLSSNYGRLKDVSLVKKYSNTSGMKGLYIKTNIIPNYAGFIHFKMQGSTYTTSRAIDTQIGFYHAATGTITSSTMVMLNKGVEFSKFSAFTDMDGTLSIYIPTSLIYTLNFMELYASTNSAVFDNSVQKNRIVNASAVTSHITTGTNFITCPIAGVFNFGSAVNRTKTVWVATEDGDDGDRGNDRAYSCKTVEQAMKNAGSVISNDVILFINRFKTAAPATYDSAVTYAVGSLVRYNGFVYEKLTTSAGTPSITSTIWKILPDTQATLQDGCVWRGAYQDNTNYSVGDVVTFTGSAANSREMTYICTLAISGNYNTTHRPTGTLISNRNWTPLGRYNPVIPATTISNCKGIRIITGNGTSELESINLIVRGTLSLAKNGSILIESRIVCSTLTLDYCGSLHTSQELSANVIAGSYCGTLRFGTIVYVHAYITHANAARVVYYGTTNIKTDIPTRNAVTANHTEILFCSTVTATGNNTGDSSTIPAANNTANCFHAANGGKIKIIGGASATNITVTVDGFGNAALNASFGGTIEFNCRTLVVNQSTNGIAGKVLRAETNGTIVRGKNNEIITRNQGQVDEFIGNALYIDYTDGILEITDSNVLNYIINDWLEIPSQYKLVFVNTTVQYGYLNGIKPAAGTSFKNGQRITIMGNCNFVSTGGVDFAMSNYLSAYSNSLTGGMVYAFQDFIFWNNRWYSKWY